MPKNFVEKSIQIDAPASKVWRVFTVPSLTRQMGGEYVSDWQVGSSLRWKGASGELQTNGTILKIEPEKLLQHNLLSADSQTAPSVTSVITYEFHEQAGHTELRAREEFAQAVNDAEYSDALEGWEAALQSVKAIAEKS